MSSSNDFIIENGVLKAYRGSDADVTIPDGVRSIGSNVFREHSGLKSVTIPEGVASIGRAAFELCKDLQTVTLPDSLEEIFDWAFGGCESLKDIRVPNGITEIRNGVFRLCKSLSNVILPNRLKKIGESAFGECKNLPHISLPDGLTVIDSYAFAFCRDLKNIDLPDSLTKIGSIAFEGCESISDVRIPEGVDRMEDYVFSGCKSLRSVLFSGPIESIGDWAFARCGELTQIELPEGTQRIGKEAFLGCKSLSLFRLPGALCEIGPGAFGFSGISAFSVSPANKKYKAENGALLSASGNKLIVYPPNADPAVCGIPDSVKQIGSKAFYGVSACGHITLKKGVKMSPSSFYQSDRLFAVVYSPEDAAVPDAPIFIGNIDKLPPKLKNAAVKGFLYAEEHGIKEIARYRKSYLEHIRRNVKTYLKSAQEDAFLTRLLITEAMIPEKEIDAMLTAADRQGNATLKAHLLEYRQAQFGAGAPSDFVFEDDDPEIRRRLKMQERKEQIKGQKGIKGLTFVATGEFRYFGLTDEYTCEKDMSDLKEYIEKRGGFYRSAVSGRTDYLICNDPNSNSVKSKKAKELGVTAIDEETFLRMANEKDGT